MDEPKKKIFLITTGCQMNEYDSELIRSILAKENYSFVKDELRADIVMLNTCAIRENAHRKVYGRIHDIRNKAKKHGNIPPMIGVLGCMATNLRKELLDNKSLKIDFIAGPDSYKRLPDLIREASTTGKKLFDVTLSEFETYSDVYPTRAKGVDAGIAVMRGCNNFCSFCVVPFTRGRERSREPQNVVDEVRHLVKEGFKQVTLLGQNVNSYKYEDYDFAYLIEKICEVDGLERIRFMSPHPKDFPDRLVHVIAKNKKACKHIHLPLQAGNNRILDMMNRTYTKEEFLALAQKIRTIYPDIVLTTDIIVGFPTESESDFEDTIKVMQEVKFDFAYIFKYSERQNTAAMRQFPDDIPDTIKTERILRLNDIQKEIAAEKNRAHIGQIHEVLVDQLSTPRSNDDFQGRNDGNKLVIFKSGPYRLGDMVKVKITDSSAFALKGSVV